MLAANVASEYDEEMAQILMKSGARPDSQDKDGNTPISLAIQNENFKLIKVFINGFDKEIASKPEIAINWKLEENKNKNKNKNASHSFGGDEDEDDDLKSIEEKKKEE
eukprot:427109_1